MNNPKCLETLAIVLGLLVLGICIFGWIKGRARIRVTILVFGILVIWVLSFLGSGRDTNFVMSVTTLIGVIAALFVDEFKKIVYRPDISIYVGKTYSIAPKGCGLVAGLKILATVRQSDAA